jgi:hypothetical protein
VGKAFLLFLISFWLHGVGGRWEYNDEQLQHGGTTVTLLEYMGTSRFWFESLQNWQSELHCDDDGEHAITERFKPVRSHRLGSAAAVEL